MKHTKKHRPRKKPKAGSRGAPTVQPQPQTRPSARFVAKCNSEMGIEPSILTNNPVYQWLVVQTARLLTAIKAIPKIKK